MKAYNVVFFIFLLLSTLFSCKVPSESKETANVSTYERVQTTGVLRVGYISYPPGFIKDPKTGAFSGIFYDVLQEVGKNLNIKIDYTHEVGWATMIEEVKNGKVDIIGSPVWPTSQRGKQVGFSIPIFYSGVGVYVRSNDTRFDKSLSVVNSKNIKIATMDGELTSTIATFDFPAAKTLSISQSSDISQLFLNVSDKKADVTFAEPVVAYNYIQKNPNKLKNIASQKPIRIYPNEMVFPIEDVALKSMIDNAIEELINNGFVDKIIAKYEPFPGAFYRNATTYRSK